MAYVIHCADPLGGPGVDAVFAQEAEVAIALGLHSLLIDHDALVAGDMRGTLRRVRNPEPGPAVYRGWMMRAEAYARLHAALSSRGVELLVSPQAYAACHHLPEAYASVGRWMPETTWVEADAMDDPEALRSALAAFGAASVTVKDWVKSQAAGYWAEACLIPDASDVDAVWRVTRRFRDLQGSDLVGGLVFRRLVDLRRVGGEAVEWRVFSLDGTPVGCWPRFEASGHEPPPGWLLQAIAEVVPSPFATFDLAEGADGRWWLMETGDGQVSGFPDGSEPQVLTALTQSLGFEPASR